MWQCRHVSPLHWAHFAYQLYCIEAYMFIQQWSFDTEDEIFEDGLAWILRACYLLNSHDFPLRYLKDVYGYAPQKNIDISVQRIQ